MNGEACVVLQRDRSTNSFFPLHQTTAVFGLEKQTPKMHVRDVTLTEPERKFLYSNRHQSCIVLYVLEL